MSRSIWRTQAELRFSRRGFLKSAAVAGVGLTAPQLFVDEAFAKTNLIDPATQPKFAYDVPDALAPSFKYTPDWTRKGRKYVVGAGPSVQFTGLVAKKRLLPTKVFGYGQDGVYSWPGKTFEVDRNEGLVTVEWENNLFGEKHLVPIDTSVHWCYALEGYQNYTIKKNGIPLVPHLHGGNTDDQFDGYPEAFFTPGAAITGPQWTRNGYHGRVPDFVYDVDVPAAPLWYHDHALGITRANVYAGLAGFFFIRDDKDTGRADNPLALPAHPYEMALAIQDRMFDSSGALFFPGYPGDPAWADFITGEGLSDNAVPQPSIMAEFFGDHMLVNGVIWPKAEVEPRHYRLRLLNGCDSRFLAIQFVLVDGGVTDPSDSSASQPLPFYVIGSDQGLASSAVQVDTLVVEPGSRYDLVVDFSYPLFRDNRVILKNIAGDSPFNGDLSAVDVFDNRQTDRIMAFDVVKRLQRNIRDAFHPGAIGGNSRITRKVDNVRRVGLYEGRDKYGRLQPMLGTVADDLESGTPLMWHMEATETPVLGSTEEWQIYNFTEDAHPVHLHLVHFEILGRNEMTVEGSGAGAFDGMGASLPLHIEVGAAVTKGPADGFVENAPKDMVMALPGQVTRIKATFQKPGDYVWHCHILSHEDHDMMRPLTVQSRRVS